MNLISHLALATAISVAALSNNECLAQTESFAVGEKTFLLNDQPFVVKAAELHYPRIPQQYWENRIEMCKALGMNTICLYVFWNAHEPQPDVYDFTGQCDLRAFVELCKKHDMKVILRPGPYVCAEWEMGGLPWWLLKNPDIRLREDDPYFLERVTKFEQAVAQQVADLTIDNGGPIIMVQVENEYGSYGTNKPYIAAVRDIVRANYPNTVLFQCDWSSNFTNNGLDDLVWTMNFGTGANIDNQFRHLQQLRPDSPLMCSEYWSGWFDKWGANHETRKAEAMIAGIDEMLSKGISFSLYMTHGGTNWGHWAGANSPGYAPDVTSYDYDAPISESGQATPKYDMLRQTLSKYSDKKLPSVPKAIKPIAVPEFSLNRVAPVFDNLPQPIRDYDIKSMEMYDQGFGSIIYSTQLPALDKISKLRITEPHDYAQVFIDGKYIGKLDRRKGEKTIMIPPTQSGSQLDILVEATGRINFGRAIKDYKGITDRVELITDIDGRSFVCDLKDWSVYLLPDSLDFYTSMTFTNIEDCDTADFVPGVYAGTFKVNKPSDTFLDFSSWGKGLVYVNGHALGRIWGIGPQQTLYTPGCWLKKGDNEIVVFDVIGPRAPVSRGLTSPLIDNLQPELLTNLIAEDEQGAFSTEGLSCVNSGTLKQTNDWQSVSFDKTVKGSTFILEALDSYDTDNRVAIAEIYVLDADGNRISREPWSIRYCSSADTATNSLGAKAYDLQESTCWISAADAKTPHTLAIDLGDTHKISGFQIIGRMESGAPAAIKNYRVYVR